MAQNTTDTAGVTTPTADVPVGVEPRPYHFDIKADFSDLTDGEKAIVQEQMQKDFARLFGA